MNQSRTGPGAEVRSPFKAFMAFYMAAGIVNSCKRVPDLADAQALTVSAEDILMGPRP